MRSETLCAICCLMAAFAASAFAQQNDSCSALMNVKVPSLEITKAARVEAGTTEAIPWNQTRSAPLPGYCRLEGVHACAGSPTKIPVVASNPRCTTSRTRLASITPCTKTRSPMSRKVYKKNMPLRKSQL